MTVEIISWSISTKVWDQAGIELATPWSAVRHASVARHVTDCSTRPGFSQASLKVFPIQNCWPYMYLLINFKSLVWTCFRCFRCYQMTLMLPLVCLVVMDCRKIIPGILIGRLSYTNYRFRGHEGKGSLKGTFQQNFCLSRWLGLRPSCKLPANDLSNKLWATIVAVFCGRTYKISLKKLLEHVQSSNTMISYCPSELFHGHTTVAMSWLTAFILF